jgi:hypothetical protein
MFSSVEERIIPRKRINLTSVITQIFLGLFLLLIFGFTLFPVQLLWFSENFYSYLTPVFIIFLIFVPLGLGLFGQWVQHQKWKALADELGFQTEQRNRFTLPTLKGTYRGHRLIISQSSQRRGRSRVYFTNYLVTLNTPTSESFEIKRRSITHFNRNQTGDEEFDKKHSTQASSEKMIDKLLRTRRLRLGMMQLGERSRTKTLTLNGASISYVEGGQTADTEYMRGAINFLAELSNAIERMDQLDNF